MSGRLAAALTLATLALAACAPAGGGLAGAGASPKATEERPAVPTATARPAGSPRATATPRPTPARPGLSTLAPAPEPATPVDLTFSGSVSGRVRSANASNPCGKAIVGFAAVLDLSLSGQPAQLTIELIQYNGPGTYAIPPERVSLRVGPPGTPILTAQKGSAVVDGTERAGKVDATMIDGTTHVTGSWSCA